MKDKLDLQRLLDAFSGVALPIKQAKEAVWGAPNLALQALDFIEIDWSKLQPERLKGLEDIPFYLTDETLLFVLPKVIGELSRTSEDLIRLELIDNLMWLPILEQGAGFWRLCTPNQRAAFSDSYLLVIGSLADEGELDWIDDKESLSKKVRMRLQPFHG